MRLTLEERVLKYQAIEAQISFLYKVRDELNTLYLDPTLKIEKGIRIANLIETLENNLNKHLNDFIAGQTDDFGQI